jgi:hypothetical protein
MEEWRKLHNEELNNLYYSSIIIKMIKSRKMGSSGNVKCMEENRSMYRTLFGKAEEQIPLGRLGYGWQDDIKMNL